jgi:hypothetical protein
VYGVLLNHESKREDFLFFVFEALAGHEGPAPGVDIRITLLKMYPLDPNRIQSLGMGVTEVRRK